MENNFYKNTRVFVIPEYQENVTSVDTSEIKDKDVTVKRAKAFLKQIENEVPLNRNSFRYMAESSEGFRRMLCRYYLPPEYQNLDPSMIKTEFPSFGRGDEKNVRYDLLMNSKDEDVFVEVEALYTKESSKRSIKRAMFYLSRLITASLKDGEKYEDLPNCIVIYLSNRDIMEEGKPFYTFRMREDESKEALSDCEEILVFVNLTYRGDDDYGRVAHDFNVKDVEEMNDGAIKESMEKVKGKDEESNMREAEDFITSIQKEEYAKGVEYGQKTGYSKGIKTGASKEKNTTIERMLKLGEFSINQIARATSASIDDVNKVAAKLGL